MCAWQVILCMRLVCVKNNVFYVGWDFKLCCLVMASNFILILSLWIWILFVFLFAFLFLSANHLSSLLLYLLCLYIYIYIFMYLYLPLTALRSPESKGTINVNNN